jgi:hypothetical protein
MTFGAGAMHITSHYLKGRRSWWKLILSGLLAFAFGIAAVILPARIMFGRTLDVIFGEAKPLSGSMTVVAALLALVAVVAIDGPVNLLGSGLMVKRAAGFAVLPDWQLQSLPSSGPENSLSCRGSDRIVGHPGWSAGTQFCETC